MILYMYVFSYGLVFFCWFYIPSTTKIFLVSYLALAQSCRPTLMQARS